MICSPNFLDDKVIGYGEFKYRYTRNNILIYDKSGKRLTGVTDRFGLLRFYRRFVAQQDIL